MDFKLHSQFRPTGDQPQAIEALTRGLNMGLSDQVLLGVTGSGKTFTMANIIANVNRPTLVLAHNKTLAAQLCSEFREFFPENAVEYFISYYDYYQPEAYIAQTDTYIEKDSSINDEIERLRHSATSALSERRDVIVVSSVSCIYGLGDPIDYKNMVISLRPGMEYDRDELMRKLTDIRYERNDINFVRNAYRVRGDTLEVYPAYWAGRADVYKRQSVRSRWPTPCSSSPTARSPSCRAPSRPPAGTTCATIPSPGCILRRWPRNIISR